MENPHHEANRQRWNAASLEWAQMHERKGTWKACHKEPSLVFTSSELKYLGELSGKKVCVLGSGDNLASFALAGTGALVTSVDISQGQLDVAASRAEFLNLEITFIQSDVCNLSALPIRSFDAVYTGGHVAVWVSDLNLYYAGAGRILKESGIFIVNEYHPFRRIWKH